MGILFFEVTLLKWTRAVVKSNIEKSLSFLIDDDVYDHSQIKMVKIDDPEEALEYGLKTLPALVFFEHKMPNIYEGNLLEAHKVSSWITDIAMEDKIEFVTPAMLDKLLDDYMNIAVFIHDRQV